MNEAIVEDTASGKTDEARLFVAVSPPASVIAHLLVLKDLCAGLPWVRSENIHLTLRFIGNLPVGDLPLVKESLRSVRAAPFCLRLIGLGLFPGRRRSVLWAGVEPSQALFALKAQVDEALSAALGPVPDSNRWQPHITLSRLKASPPAALRRVVRERAGVFHGEFVVTAFTLFRSRFEPGRVVHVPEEVYEL